MIRFISYWLLGIAFMGVTNYRSLKKMPIDEQQKWMSAYFKACILILPVAWYVSRTW